MPLRIPPSLLHAPLRPRLPSAQASLRCSHLRPRQSAAQVPLRLASTSPYSSPSHVDDSPRDGSRLDHDESHDHGHDSKYDPPTGWLWGLRPGEKYENEGWEYIFFYGYWGSIILAAVLYAFKPDTTIQTWALEEARRRLEKEGILEDPDDVKKP